MSALRPNARLLGWSGSCLVPGCSVAFRATPPAFLRNAATAAKPRAKKPASTAGITAAAIEKKPLSTRIPAKTTGKPTKKAEPPASSVLASKPAATTSDKTKRSVSPKIIAATKVPAKAQAKREVKAETASTPVPKTAPETPAAPTVSPIGAWKPTPKPREPAPPVKKPADVKSPEYKTAARKWTALMVALPVLFVTSYFLFDRLALGNGPGLMDPVTPPPPPKDKTLEL